MRKFLSLCVGWRRYASLLVFMRIWRDLCAIFGSYALLEEFMRDSVMGAGKIG